MELSQEDFDGIRAHIYRLCGLVLPDEKKYLVLQRLGPVVRKIGCKTFAEFHRKLVSDPDQLLKRTLIESMTTNETSFFRDVHPFSAFEKYILPEFADSVRQRKLSGKPAGGGGIRLWCAAASTGQEPYSLAMLIDEFATANRHRGIAASDFTIVATDISPAVLDKASVGEYTQAEISRGLSEERKKRYFTKNGHSWKINEQLRRMVEYRLLNLVGSHGHLGKFDAIFCRNVLIYFDLKTRERIIGQFHQMLTAGGLLVLGASETLNAQALGFESVQYGLTSFFRKKKARAVGLTSVAPEKEGAGVFVSALSWRG